MCSIRSGAIRWLIPTFIKVVLDNFSIALTVCRSYILYDFQKFCDFENIGQSHAEQLSQWRCWMANVNTEKDVAEHFSL